MQQQNPNELRVKLHKAQLDFVRCNDAPYIGFVGGRGAGKSVANAAAMWKYSMTEPGLYGLYAPTYPMLHDTIMRTFLDTAKVHITSHSLSNGVIRMQSGSEILCRSLDDPERARGPSLRGGAVDEASLCSVDAFNILIACLRFEGKQGWLRCTFTPKGPAHWTADLFNDPTRTDARVFHAKTSDNPFNPPEFSSTLSRQYTATFAQQELDGRFINLGGSVYKSEWIKVVDRLPENLTLARAWDFAASEKQAGRSDDPDYTVGALIGRSVDKKIFICDIRRGRYGPEQVCNLPGQVAAQDGKNVRIILEQEGGSGGKIFASSLVRSLQQYVVKAIQPRGDKMTRSMPLFAQAEAGNVYMLRAPWNRDFLSEVDSFGSGGHDDQIDACAHAYNAVAASAPAMAFS